MENVEAGNENLDDAIQKSEDMIEAEKEEKLIRLIIEIIVKATLKKYYEESD